MQNCRLFRQFKITFLNLIDTLCLRPRATHFLTGPVALAAVTLVGQSAASIFPPQPRGENIARDDTMMPSDGSPPPAYGNQSSGVSKDHSLVASTSSNSVSADAITMGFGSSDNAVLVSSTSTAFVTPLPVGSFTVVNLHDIRKLASTKSRQPLELQSPQPPLPDERVISS